MFDMAKTLIVVYKDEMIVNQLKKLVETNDVSDDEQIVGTRGNSINIVAWTEKVWIGNKKAGNIKDKVLFLDNIKGTDKLIPVIDVKFDDCGVKFGWAGNQAVLSTDIKAISSDEDYLAFIKKLAVLPVPEMIKKPVSIKSEEYNEIVSNEIIEVTHDIEEKKEPVLLRRAKEGIFKGVDAVGKVGRLVADKTADLLKDKKAIKRQMMFYGVVNLYRDGLREFMNV